MNVRSNQNSFEKMTNFPTTNVRLAQSQWDIIFGHQYHSESPKNDGRIPYDDQELRRFDSQNKQN